MSMLLSLIGRELTLARRQGSDAAIAILFFLLVPALVAFGLGPDRPLLTRVAPGMIWIAALLAVLLSVERLFSADAEDGSLDLLASHGIALEAIAFAKAVAHWLTTGLPLILATPLVALLLGLPGEALPALLLSLALGTPSLSLLGGVVAALLIAARRGGVLLALLALPLYIPVLIFGAAAVDAAVQGLAVAPHLRLLGAILALALPLSPFAMAAALKEALR